MATLPDSQQFSSLPAPIRQLVETTVLTGPLGTSAVIGMYGRALQLLAIECTARSGLELAGQALFLIEYFLDTRGHFTAAVANSFVLLRTQLRDLQRAGRGVEEVTQALLDFNRDLELDRQARLNSIVSAGVELLGGAESLLLYDYSSTVLKVVAALVESNQNLKLVVPESRTCDGGLPIVRQGLELECRLWLIPDIAIAFAASRCDAVLVGVESFYRDGSFTNTVGSLTTAIVANHFAIPFYAVTDLTKADRDGDRVSQPLRSFSKWLTEHSDFADEVRVETAFPPLEKVPEHLVTAYITEFGVVEPARAWSTALSENEGGVE